MLAIIAFDVSDLWYSVCTGRTLSIKSLLYRDVQSTGSHRKQTQTLVNGFEPWPLTRSEIDICAPSVIMNLKSMIAMAFMVANDMNIFISSMQLYVVCGCPPNVGVPM